MNSCYRDSRAVCENDHLALDWLYRKCVGIPSLPYLSRSAEAALRHSDASFGVDVLLSWPVLCDVSESTPFWIYVGGLVELDNSTISRASYFLCVARDGKQGERRKVLRKYHFDYAMPGACRDRPHPVFHLQYPGTLPRELRAEDLDDEHMDPWLGEPRIFYTPMSLALILHFAFREFPNNYTERIRKDGYWRGILRRDQERLLLPFFQTCVSLMERDKKVILDVAYDL